MSDLSATSQPAPDPSASAAQPPSLWLMLKKGATRLQDWFTIQSLTVKVMVVAVALLIPRWPSTPLV